MKRLSLALLILLAAVPAMAFRSTVRHGDRVGVLRPSLFARGGVEYDVANAVTRSLQRELRERGIQAVDAQATFEDLQRDRGSRTADYYVEVVASDANGGPYGGVGVGGPNVGVDVAVVVSHVAATLRLYDGHTLDLIDTYDMHGKAAAVLPTAVGIGGRHVGFWVALPFVQYARYRAAAHAVASDAADAIAGQTRAD